MKKSAGILLFRKADINPEVLLVHPGGPFWAKKNEGTWSIPKGEYEDGDDPLETAIREFREELGSDLQGEPFALTQTKLRSGKSIIAFACEGDLDKQHVTSNTFNMEWPPRSGKYKDFPEIDRAEWFTLSIAKEMLNPAQVVFIDELVKALLKSRNGQSTATGK